MNFKEYFDSHSKNNILKSNEKVRVNGTPAIFDKHITIDGGEFALPRETYLFTANAGADVRNVTLEYV